MGGPFDAFDVYTLGAVLCHCDGHDIHALASTCRALHAMVVACYRKNSCLGFYLSDLARLYSLCMDLAPYRDPVEKSRAFRRCFADHTCYFCGQDEAWNRPSTVQCKPCRVVGQERRFNFMQFGITPATKARLPVFAIALVLDGIVALAKEACADQEGFPTVTSRASLPTRWLQFLSTFEIATTRFLADRFVLRGKRAPPFGWIGRILMLRPEWFETETAGRLEKKICALLEFVIVPSLFHRLHWQTVLIWCGVYGWRHDLAPDPVPVCPSPSRLRDLDHEARLSHLAAYDPVDFVTRTLSATFSALLWNEAFPVLGHFLRALKHYVSLRFPENNNFARLACEQYQGGIETEVIQIQSLMGVGKGGRGHLCISFEFCAGWRPEPTWAERYWGISVSVQDSAALLLQQRNLDCATAFFPIITWLQFPVFLKTLLDLWRDETPEFKDHVGKHFSPPWATRTETNDEGEVRQALVSHCQDLFLSRDADNFYGFTPQVKEAIRKTMWNAWDIYSPSVGTYIWLKEMLCHFRVAPPKIFVKTNQPTI